MYMGYGLNGREMGFWTWQGQQPQHPDLLWDLPSLLFSGRWGLSAGVPPLPIHLYGVVLDYLKRRENFTFLPSYLTVSWGVKIYIVIFWVVTPYNLVGGYKRFGETCFLHLQGRSDSVML
jgi:hypothetical protein